MAAMGQNKKTIDLQRNMKDQHSKQPTTTDSGTKISDLDHWLRPVNEEKSKIGPQLLEDQIARERVCDSGQSGPYTLTA